MASDTQYKAFQKAYDEEATRCADLRNTAKIYLTICSFFLGGLAFKLNDILVSTGDVQKTFTLMSIVTFAAAFVFLIIALGMYSYKTLFDPINVIEELGAAPPSDDEFRMKRIANVADAWEVNFQQNERRARYLRFASISMVAGVLTGATSLIVMGLTHF